MANSLCSTPLTSIKVPSQPGLIVGNSAARKVIWINDTTRYCKTVKLQSFQAKAADGDKSTTKTNSIVCADCDGNVFQLSWLSPCTHVPSGPCRSQAPDLLSKYTFSGFPYHIVAESDSVHGYSKKVGGEDPWPLFNCLFSNDQLLNKHKLLWAIRLIDSTQLSGAKLCPECQGTGVNPEDKRNGQFKAGGLCWLCRGKQDILCGNCNGAGFMGGFMNTFDD